MQNDFHDEIGAHLADALLVLTAEQHRPRDPTGVLALEEKRFRLSGGKPENLTVTADVELSL